MYVDRLKENNTTLKPIATGCVLDNFKDSHPVVFLHELVGG
jgi:hypothetical protein